MGLGGGHIGEGLGGARGGVLAPFGVLPIGVFLIPTTQGRLSSSSSRLRCTFSRRRNPRNRIIGITARSLEVTIHTLKSVRAVG
jgi:hypothetical protein